MTKKIEFRRAFSLIIMTVATSAVFAQKDTPEYMQWYVGITAGASVIESEEKIPNMIGLYGAYFFNQKYGAGLVARKCDYYSIEDLFLGAAFFAHWGRSNAKLFFPTRIGLGVNRNTYVRNSYNRQHNFWQDEYISTTELGCYASAGIAIRPTKLISFGINAEWATSFEDIADSEGLLGVSIGISFHF